MKGFLPVRKPPVELESLAKTPLSELHRLPASAGVYLAIDGGQVWYVGLATTSIRKRLSEHERLGDFRAKGVAEIAYTKEADDERCRELEKELIRFYHPPLNSQLNFNDLPRGDLGLLSFEAEVERFLRLKIWLKLIKLELDALSPGIVSQWEQAAGGKLTHQLGTITCQIRRTWQFSEDAEKLEQELLQLQEEEKENGRATVRSERTSPRASLNTSAIDSAYSELAIRLSMAASDERAEDAEDSE